MNSELHFIIIFIHMIKEYTWYGIQDIKDTLASAMDNEIGIWDIKYFEYIQIYLK